MKQTRRQSTRPAAKAVIFALLAGLVVLLLLFPANGVDTDPPACYSFLFYPVPCDRWIAPLAGVAAAGLVGWLLRRNDRRRG